MMKKYTFMKFERGGAGSMILPLAGFVRLKKNVMKNILTISFSLCFFCCLSLHSQAQTLNSMALNENSSLASITPPVLVADSTQNDINHAIEIGYKKDSAWTVNISEIWINGRAVHFSFYDITEDSIVLHPDVFSAGGTNNILVKATGYKDATLAQELGEGGVWDNKITGVFPADNSFNIGSDTVLILNFEKSVTIEEGSIKIFKIEYITDDGLYELISSTSESVAGSGTNQLIITSSKGFSPGSYYIMIDDNLFGQNFKGFNRTFDWTFTTSFRMDELIPGESLGHDVRLTISLPGSFNEDVTKKYPGIFILDAPWFTGMHTDLHNLYKRELIPLDPVVITIGPKYSSDINEIRELDYTRNYSEFYDYLKNYLVPYATELYRIDPSSRIMEGASYAGFMTLYSFFQSCLRQDTTFYSFAPSSPVMAGYYSMMDQLSASKDSLGKNLIYFVAEFDLDVCLPVHPLLNTWVEENDFSYFNYYDEIDKGKIHTTTSVNAFVISTEIILNLPKPYFTFAKYNFSEDDANSYPITRRWPKDGTLSGDGVSDTCFIPSLAGRGIHTITYTYTDDNNQTFFREREVTVGNVGIEELTIPNLHIHPNPAKEFVTMTFNLEKQGFVRISIYNILGKEDLVLLNETRMAGDQEVQLDISGLTPGVYFVKLASDHIETCKLIVR